MTARKSNKKMVVKKHAATSTPGEQYKIVGRSAKNGRVYLPSSWIGKKVSVRLV